MRGLYIYGAMMVSGVLIMLFSSYRILNVLDAAKSGFGTQHPGLQSYVMVSYCGVGLFLLGALGAIVMILKAMNRR